MTNLLEQLENDIEMAQDIEFNTENILCPQVEAPAKIHKISRQMFVADGVTYHMLGVRWEIDDADAREETKQDRVFVDQSIFLKLDEDSSQLEDKDVNKQLWVILTEGNPEFGRLIKWAKSIGYEMSKTWGKFWVEFPEWAVGKEARVKVKHRPWKTKELDETGEPIVTTQAYVGAVAKL